MKEDKFVPGADPRRDDCSMDEDLGDGDNCKEDGGDFCAWSPAVGKVVQLRSGGPPMTVTLTQPGGGGLVQCVWFTSDGLTHAGPFHNQFPAECLKPY